MKKMREKLVRFSKEEHQKLLEIHKALYPDSWKYVPFAETVTKLINHWWKK